MERIFFLQIFIGFSWLCGTSFDVMTTVCWMLWRFYLFWSSLLCLWLCCCLLGSSGGKKERARERETREGKELKRNLIPFDTCSPRAVSKRLAYQYRQHFKFSLLVYFAMKLGSFGLSFVLYFNQVFFSCFYWSFENGELPLRVTKPLRGALMRRIHFHFLLLFFIETKTLPRVCLKYLFAHSCLKNAIRL